MSEQAIPKRFSYSDKLFHSRMTAVWIIAVLLIVAGAFEAVHYMVEKNSIADSGSISTDALSSTVKVTKGVKHEDNQLFVDRDAGTAQLTFTSTSSGAISITITSTRAVDYMASMDVYLGTSKNADKLLFHFEEPALQGEETTYTFFIPRQYVKQLYLDIPSQRGYWKITGLRVGQTEISPSLSIKRVVMTWFILIVIFLIARGGRGVLYDPSQKKHVYVIAGSAILSLTVFLFTSEYLTGTDYRTDIPYPLEKSVSSYQNYIQEFDAMMKHQVYLDVEPSKELLALANPYERGARDGITALWDRSFYEGKYYSYFGMAPIFQIYFPYYWLTGRLPSESLVMWIYAMILMIASIALMLNLFTIMKKRPPLWMVAASICLVPWFSGALLLMRGRAPVYYIAVLSGLSMGVLYVFLVTLAFIQKKTGRRHAGWISLFFAGSAFAFCLMGRPSMAVPVFLVSLPFLRRLFMSFARKKFCLYWQEMVFTGLPVAAGLAFIFWHNYVRFGSIMDFGSAYMLTVTDTREYTLTLSKLPAALYYYFLKPCTIKDTWPIYEFAAKGLLKHDYYLYRASYMGLLNNPLFFGMLIWPLWFLVRLVKALILKAKGKTDHIYHPVADPVTTEFLWMCFLASITGIWLVYCLGGVYYRYAYDFQIFWVIGCVMTLGLLLRNVKKKPFLYESLSRLVMLVILVALVYGMSRMLYYSATGFALYDPRILASFKDLFY